MMRIWSLSAVLVLLVACGPQHAVGEVSGDEEPADLALQVGQTVTIGLKSSAMLLTASSNALVQSPNTGQPQQLWTLSAAGAHFTFTQGASGSLLGTGQGGAATLSAATGAATQTWDAQASSGGFLLRNVGSSQCLTVANINDANATVTLTGCTGGDTQQLWQTNTITAPAPTSTPNTTVPPAAPVAPAAPTTTASGFLGAVSAANGPMFGVNNQVVHLVGAQLPMPDVTPCGQPLAEVQKGMDALVQGAKANTVRMWFLQSAGGPQDWSHFDAAVAEAKKRNLKIVATLVNEWGNCEPQVNGALNYKQLAWYQGGYKTAQDGYPLAYRDFAVAVAQHYANEPTIGLWQLVNEAEARNPVDSSCPSESASASAIAAFADDMGKALHAVDSHHMVNLGTIDEDRCGTTGADWQRVHAGAVDACEIHSYDGAAVAMPAVVQQRIAQCHALNKPIFAGELGVCNNAQPDGSCSGAVAPGTLSQRATFIGNKLQAQSTAGLGGMILWVWDPWASVTDDPYGIGYGDPALGVLANSPH